MVEKRKYQEVYLIGRHDGDELIAQAKQGLEDHQVKVKVLFEGMPDPEVLTDSVVVFVATAELASDTEAVRRLKELRGLDAMERVNRIVPIDGGALGSHFGILGVNIAPLELGGTYPQGILSPIERMIKAYGLQPATTEGGRVSKEQK